MKYAEMKVEELKAILKKEKAKYEGYKAMGLALDMSRGKPCKEQLNLSMGLLDELYSGMEIGKTDPRNYGGVDGLVEAKKLFGDLMGVTTDEIIVGGNSSLNMMYDSIMRYYCFGAQDGGKPWSEIKNRKWLCVVPGYDRHFAVTEEFGFENIQVPMLESGPDMDKIEELIKDDSVKGIWCVPKYSNPDGVVFSDETVKRFARLQPAAKDFRIFWDNAYGVHDISSACELLDILSEAKIAGNPDIVLIFGSTSKISFAGAGVAYLCASRDNIGEIKKRMSIQTIGPDKLNQLAHVKYFKTAENIREHMKKHAAILKPKFETVLNILSEELAGTGICDWKDAKGGYFVSCNVFPGTAKKVVEAAKAAGVIFTPAGATYPKKNDIKDSNLRIAPSLPPIKELEVAMRVFVCVTKICAIEKILE